MKNLDIIVVGELNVDLIITGLPSLPEKGKCIISKDMNLTMGSASAIFAYNIAKFGMKVGFIGKIGDDEFGEFMLECLKERNINVSQIIKDSTSKTGICVSISFPDGYTMIGFPGVRENLSIKDIDLEYLKKAKHMHLSSYFLQTGLLEGCPLLFKRSKELGLTTSFDPDWDPEERWNKSIFKVLKHVDIFLPNEEEALSITGCSDIKSALDLLSKEVETVVIKRGSKSTIAKKGNKMHEANVFKVKVIDTTGAGDSFNAGFLYKYLNGASIEDCLIFGNACGAISTIGSGGTSSFPTLQGVENFLKERAKEVKVIISK